MSRLKAMLVPTSLLSCLALLSLVACGNKGTGEPVPVALLVEVLAGQASHRGIDMAWKPSKAGDLFFDGEALRTGEHGVARLKFAGELLRMGPETVVFFGTKKVEFDGEIEVGEGFMKIGLDFGDAEVATTGRVRLTKHDDSLKFKVLEGVLTISESGEVEEVLMGEGFDFDLSTGAGENSKAQAQPRDAGAEFEGGDGDASTAPVQLGVMAFVIGKGVRVRSDKKAPWRRLKSGEHDLGAFAEIQIKGSKAKLVLSRGDDKVTLLGTGLASVRADASEIVSVSKGRVTGSSKSSDVLIAVPGGAVRLHSSGHGTIAGINVRSSGAATQVQTGEVTLLHGTEQESLLGGESATLTRSGIASTDKGPTDAYMTLRTPRAVTVHVIKPPTNIRIDFRKHCGRGAVEVDDGGNFRKVRVREGDGAAIVRFSRGVTRYRVRCYEESGVLGRAPVAAGKVTIVRDSGSRPLARSIPRAMIEPDGRVYTVQFSDHMPALDFRWPKAPKSRSYVLHVEPTSSFGKSRTVNLPSAKASFTSGAYPEGRYKFWFGAGDRESKHGEFSIEFDNTAATAYLSRPRANAALLDASTVVKGAAVRGWSVSVDGKDLALDRQLRFDEEVPVGRDGISVRFSHPKYGVHYYLRRKHK